mmetsp:Transcript_5714/g.8545  ORF Transcript_5714/g.8545 Transcript_5714/m.8545 type:complete len:217 (-) Transcript_5714:1259-1909(-)
MICPPSFFRVHAQSHYGNDTEQEGYCASERIAAGEGKERDQVRGAQVGDQPLGAEVSVSVEGAGPHGQGGRLRLRAGLPLQPRQQERRGTGGELSGLSTPSSPCFPVPASSRGGQSPGRPAAAARPPLHTQQQRRIGQQEGRQEEEARLRQGRRARRRQTRPCGGGAAGGRGGGLRVRGAVALQLQPQARLAPLAALLTMHSVPHYLNDKDGTMAT